VSNLVLIFLCLFLGILVKRTGRFPLNTAQALNSFIIFISLPSLVLIQVTRLLQTAQMSWSLLVPVSMAWLLFGGAWASIHYIGKKRGWSNARTGALILTAGLGNTSFVGFPLLEAMLGKEAVPWGVLVDQLGSFLVLSTLGLLVGSIYGRPRDGVKRTVLKQVFQFPPFLALISALILGSVGFVFTGIADTVLVRLGDTLVPLALVAVGFQLKVSLPILKRYGRPLTLGLFYKLILAPALLSLLYIGVFGFTDFVTRVTLLEAAMATMITSAVIASEFSLDEELANLMVGVSIPISLFTVPMWLELINLFMI